MKRSLPVVLLLVLGVQVPLLATAQQAVEQDAPPVAAPAAPPLRVVKPKPRPHANEEREISISEIPPTQELYLYQQELKRAQDPKQAIRRRAEYRAAQRERRIASQEWYGISPMRPQANVTPWTGGQYSAGWAGNTREPFLWMPQTPVVVARPVQNFNGVMGVW